MPDFCTCGAELPPDARFCHKCGRPQREEDLPQPVPTAAPLPAPPDLVAPKPGAPSFHNALAVRVGLFAASVATLLNMVLIYGFPIWLVAAGFFSVYLYGRRTGQFLTIGAGARMGWITGILSFVIFTVLATLNIVAVASRSGGLPQFYRDQLRNMPYSDPNMEQALRMLESPAGLAITFLASLLFLFAIITLFCIAGGALGAKVLEKE